jgi:hypothetical protein
MVGGSIAVVVVIAVVVRCACSKACKANTTRDYSTETGSKKPGLEPVTEATWIAEIRIVKRLEDMKKPDLWGETSNA